MMILVESPPCQYSINEYLAQEETADYPKGEIVPMTIGSINHNQIIINLIIALTLPHQTNKI